MTRMEGLRGLQIKISIQATGKTVQKETLFRLVRDLKNRSDNADDSRKEIHAAESLYIGFRVLIRVLGNFLAVFLRDS